MSGRDTSGSRHPAARGGAAGPDSLPVGRREFLTVTATAVGLGIALPMLPRSSLDARPAIGGEIVEIGMRSDAAGARVWFAPKGTKARVGDTVRWINESGVHTVTAYHPANGRPLRMPGEAEPWDSGTLIDAGATFEVTPRVAGVYDFFCRPHEAAGMVGRLVVVPVGVTDPAGVPEPRYPRASPAGELPEAAASAFPTVREIVGDPAGPGDLPGRA